MSDDTVPATPESIAAALGRIERRLDGIDNRLAALEGMAAVAVTKVRFEVSENLVLSGLRALADRVGELEGVVIGIGIGKRREPAA
jgi:hypothetical protein